ncbi:MAG: hypothetical protein LBG09_03000 [Puniceicoccales bacterium]|jgi:hypothetical protein|nr:hypothetical protein [Puniceicoccales bacterium]
MKKVIKVFLGIACIFTGNGIVMGCKAADYVPEEAVPVPPEQPVSPGCPGHPGCPDGTC